jgi:hypothetical protein
LNLEIKMWILILVPLVVVSVAFYFVVVRKPPPEK